MPRRSFLVHRLVRQVAATVLSVFVLASTAGVAHADTTSATGDEYVTAPTAWATWTGKSTSEITTLLGSTYRLVDVKADSSGTYTATAVKNAGAYAAPAWWWYVHASVLDISNFASVNNARIISLQRNSDDTVNVVLVSNTGVYARSWWWYVGITTSEATLDWQANNARITSVIADPTSAGTYDVLMVGNTGADQRTWMWWVNQSVSNLATLASANNMRLIDLEPEGNGNFDAAMISATGADNVAWWWYLGWDATQMQRLADTNGARISRMVPYLNGFSQTVYAAVMVDNLAAEPRRVWNVLQTGYTQQGLSGATFGFYVRQIGGSAQIALAPSTTYEPASGIKALYNLYAEFQVQIGNDALSKALTYWYKPTDPTNKDVCPLDYANAPSNQSTTTLANGLKLMMSISDNRLTQSVDLRYGRDNVNAFAQVIGMRNTVINQTLGCGNRFSGSVTTTLSDMSRLYAGVYARQLLTAPRAATFFNRMSGGTLTSADALAAVIRSTAKALHKSSAVASAFIAHVTYRDKGGSYDNCPIFSFCNPPYLYDRSDAGYLVLPFKTAGVIHARAYTYGWWVNDLQVPCTFGTACAAKTQADATTAKVRPEIFRALVRAALKTW